MFPIKFFAAAVLLLWCVPDKQIGHPERPGTRSLQIVDTNPSQTRRACVIVDAARHTLPHRADPAGDVSRDNTDPVLDRARAWAPDSRHLATGDASPVPLALTLEALQALADAGRVTLAHPEGGKFEVTLANLTLQASGRVFSVRSDGYPGVITQRGERFFATLATTRGVYTIEHTPGTGSVAFSQRQLDLRINRQDYQRAPAA